MNVIQLLEYRELLFKRFLVDIDVENFQSQNFISVQYFPHCRPGLQSGRAGRARVGPGVIRVEPAPGSTHSSRPLTRLGW